MREVTDVSFDQDVLTAGHPVAVDFWAPWCGPCHAVTRALEQLAGETVGIEFVQLDIDANPVTAARYDVLSIPTVILFADGEPRESVVGARRPSHFRAVFAPFLDGRPAPSFWRGGRALVDRPRRAARSSSTRDWIRTLIAFGSTNMPDIFPSNSYILSSRY